MRVGLTVLLSVLFSAAARGEEGVRYNRDVRPILSDRCFRCHGPDEAAREGELRLDVREEALREAIVPGKPGASVLVERIDHGDEDERMPPVDSGSVLNAGEREILRQWIAQGARYEKHWSLSAPLRPELPEVSDGDWVRNGLDAFVLARLEELGMAPSAEATRETLARRLALDLNGLPPSVEEMDAFLSDEGDGAYGRLVERLLGSKRFGEKMAVHWLDAARFADTNGYFTDEERTMWPWRDWVIAAFNENMPFDTFTIEQVAGDLLPGASQSQKIATGFNRNHMVNGESGSIEEEFRVEYVADRVKTTSMVWLGLTFECARCHDHKYDPISQEDYYKFFAFFNNVPERGLDGKAGGAKPLLAVPSAELRARVKAAKAELAKAEAKFKPVEEQLAAAQSDWEKTAEAAAPGAPVKGLVAHYDFEEGVEGVILKGAEGGAGLLGRAVEFKGEAVVEVADGPRFDREDAFSISAWVNATSGGPACVISRIDDAGGLKGFDLVLRKGVAVAHFSHRWGADAIVVATEESVGTRRWKHLTLTYDGSGKAAGVAMYLDGEPAGMEVRMDSLTGSFAVDEPLRFGRRQASASFAGRIDEVRLYDRVLSAEEAGDLARGEFLRGVLGVPAEKRGKSEVAKLREIFVATEASDAQRAALEELKGVKGKKARADAAVPVMMVMQEKEEPRAAHVLVRGEYNRPAAEVSAGVPAGLPGLPAGADRNREGLARWLVSAENPLTARVIVNRFWAELFGRGIVATTEDFGTQGEWPTHPELLDWLACEFVDSGWDVKALLRLMVNSATYRQRSGASEESFREDPGNRLLARGPRFRMEAEMLRDSALHAGGLLVERIGGPSVKPYQPPGLWKEVTYDGLLAYEADEGEALHRRSLYTYWKRQAPPPNMLLFDAPTRDTCTVARSRTNTPLQALVLMNDLTFLEAARGLAERMMSKGGKSEREKVSYGFRVATSRRPSDEEAIVMLRIYESQLEVYRRDVKAARALTSIGSVPRDETLDVSELAAWTTVANVMLALDETITKY